jgi:hypothetical protein
MITVHSCGVWEFLRIGVGAVKINATFCVLCPDCSEKMTAMTSEEEERIVRRRAFSRAYRNEWTRITHEKNMVITATIEMAEEHMKEFRPTVKVGKDSVVIVPF